MQGFNKILICGHLGQDPELKVTPAGKSVATFSMGTSNYKKKDSEEEGTTTWFRCTVWGDSADRAVSMLAKGMAVYVQGNLEARDWTGREGDTRTSLDVMVTDWRILERKSEKAVAAKAEPGTTDHEPPPF